MKRTIIRKAHLSKRAHRNLDGQLAQLTWLWNIGLAHRRDLWEADKTKVSMFDHFKVLTGMRQAEGSVWADQLAGPQRSVLRRLDWAFKAFFRRVDAGQKPGYPRFKAGYRGVRSYEMPVCPKVHDCGNRSRVGIGGIGQVRFKKLPEEAVVKYVRLVRKPRRVEIQFVAELPDNADKDTRAPVGVDVGIKSRLALSTGETIRGVKLDGREIKRRQRKLARAKKGGNGRAKRRVELAKECQRVAEREKGVLHELTARLVKTVSARFAIEDLKITNMVKNKNLARRIHEQQWGNLANMLTYKAESAGGEVVRVDPKHTSQICSGCGHRPEKSIGLGVRTYVCKPCGLRLDRDINAAVNILHRGFPAPVPGGTTPECGENENEAIPLGALRAKKYALAGLSG